MGSFQNLPGAKQNAILSAGFVCFAQNGYAKTSMADIAGRAGVSKSLLFHYFGSKQKFWLYLYNMGVNVISTAISKGMAQTSTDFFERLWQAQACKIEVVRQYPGMFDFFYRSVKEDAQELHQGRNEENQQYIQKGFDALLQGVNWDKFKPNVNMEMVINIVKWTSEGYVNDNWNKRTPEEMGKEAYKYLNLLISAFYKEEYL